MLKDTKALNVEQATMVKALCLDLIDLATEKDTNGAWRRTKVVVDNIVVEIGYMPGLGYEVRIQQLRGWVHASIAADRVRLLEPPRCFDYEQALTNLKICIAGWPNRKPFRLPNHLDLLFERIDRVMEERGMSELQATQVVVDQMDRYFEGELVHPDLNSRKAWIKRYQTVHNVDSTDAEIEYRKRRRAMSLFDISMIEYFSSIDKDPTEPNNLREFMDSLKSE